MKQGSSYRSKTCIVGMTARQKEIGFRQYVESESYRDGAVSGLCMDHRNHRKLWFHKLVVVVMVSVIWHILDIITSSM